MSFIFGVSLTASFLAGVLALFAPCCITFLFPSYLGTIFKEGKKVAFYTIIFALGLSFVLVPVSLGARFFIFFFDAYHREVYYLGGLFLIFMGIMTLKPIFRIPQIFHFERKVNEEINVFSVFSLGVMSGLTSSCCAPVLFAAVTLTSLAPSIFQAIVVAFAYVLGIVFPLFLMSLFYKKATMKLTGEKRQKLYSVFKFLGSFIFVLSGVLIIIAAALNKIQMYQMEGYSRGVRLFIFEIAKRYFRNPIVDILSFSAIIFLFYLLLKKNK